MPATDQQKGTPFNPIQQSYLLIEELYLNPTSKHFHIRNYRIPNQLVPVKPVGRVTRTEPLTKLGHSVKLPKNKYYAALLLRNEILGCIGKASDRDALLRNFRQEYKNSIPAKTSRKYFHKFSDYRSMYNNGNVYKGQTMPPLYCWYWNRFGYIHHPRFPKQFLSFQYCKRQLTTAKFADPRFFDSQELSVITNKLSNEDPKYEGWHVPALIEIQRIEAEINKPIYNSIVFPDGFGKDFNPI